ncbi:9056_t:CDS:2, partial [Racocetra fulgida]
PKKKSVTSRLKELKNEIKNLKQLLKERKVSPEEILQNNYINGTRISHLKEENIILRSREENLKLENESLKIEDGKLNRWKKDVIKSSDGFMKRTGDNSFVASFENIVFNKNEGLLKGENLILYCPTKLIQNFESEEEDMDDEVTNIIKHNTFIKIKSRKFEYYSLTSDMEMLDTIISVPLL